MGCVGSKGIFIFIFYSSEQDDLRQDNRLMEFNGIVNKCLRKDAESRRRQLHIRTYVRRISPHSQKNKGVLLFFCSVFF